MRVDFIGVGTPKSATTWLYDALSEHPGICISKDKEVNFFLDENYKKGAGWYEERFKHCKKGEIRGEYSPNYLHSESVAERIKENFPNVKLIFSLRNPIDRFLSSHRFELGMGRHAKKDPFEQSEEKIRKELHKGLYSKHLDKFLSLFPAEQVHIIFYEDIQNNPKKVLQNLFEYLEVKNDFIPKSLYEKSNVSTEGRTRFSIIKNIYYKSYRAITSPGLRWLVPVLKRTGFVYLVRIILKLNTNSNNKKMKIDITEENRLKLIDFYREDINKLEKLTGRNLSDWLT